MSRPKKQGLEYYNVDVDMPEDDKIFQIEAECGEIAYGRIHKLLAFIYRGNGYYKKWDEKTRKLFSGKYHIPLAETDKLIKSSIDNSFFNPELYKKEKILTSARIQKNYLYASQKRDVILIEKKYYSLSSIIEIDIPKWIIKKLVIVEGSEKWVFDPKTGGFIPGNPQKKGLGTEFPTREPPVFDEKNPQNENENENENESEKENKVSGPETPPPPPFLQKIDPQKEKHLEFVYLLQGEYKALLKVYSESSIQAYIEKMNNYIGGLDPIKQSVWLKKNHYYKLLEWMEKDNIQKLVNIRGSPWYCSVCGDKQTGEICKSCGLEKKDRFNEKIVQEKRNKLDDNTRGEIKKPWEE